MGSAPVAESPRVSGVPSLAQMSPSLRLMPNLCVVRIPRPPGLHKGGRTVRATARGERPGAAPACGELHEHGQRPRRSFSGHRPRDLEGSPAISRRSSDRTFIFRIAHNRAMSHLAKRRPPALAASDDLDVQDPRPDPEAVLLRDQRYARLLAAIRELPVDYRQVMTLALEGMSYAEIALVVGIRETNVGVRLNRGRQMLRRLMEVER